MAVAADICHADSDNKPNDDFLKRFPFLKEDSGLTPEVFKDWESSLMAKDEAVQHNTIKANVFFTMNNIAEAVTTQYTSKDFMVVERGNKIEVWTMKDFKPRTICFLPESTEIKPRFYTAARAAVVKNTASLTEKRKNVLHGRIRAAPDSKSSFAMFWLVERSDCPEKKINLELAYTNTQVKTTVEILGSPHTVDWGVGDMPAIPYLRNPKKIKEHTMLIVAEDGDVKKLSAAFEKDAANVENKQTCSRV